MWKWRNQGETSRDQKRNKGQDAIKETNMKEYASLYRSRKTFLSSYITLTHLVERAANTNIYTEHNTKKNKNYLGIGQPF